MNMKTKKKNTKVKDETLLDIVKEIRSIVKRLQPSDRVIIQGNANTKMVEPVCNGVHPRTSAGICLNCGYLHSNG